jgi:glucokinase
MSSLVGIEIGGTKLQIVTGNAAGKISTRRKFVVDRARAAAGIREKIQQVLTELNGDSKKPETIGIGFGGPVDWRSGKICRSHQIEGWSEFDLAGWIRGLIEVPVSVDNDANVAALGEAKHGAGQGCGLVFYVTLGSGVGGGLVQDGEIYHGAPPGEAEIGHLRIGPSKVTLESLCSGWAVDARVREEISRSPTSPLARLVGATKGGEASHLPAALKAGDPAAQLILQETADDLALGLSHVAHLFHPEILILGGGLSKIGEPLRGRVEDSLRKLTMEAFIPGLRVALAALDEDVVPVGALELAAKAEGGPPH